MIIKDGRVCRERFADSNSKSAIASIAPIMTMRPNTTGERLSPSSARRNSSKKLGEKLGMTRGRSSMAKQTKRCENCFHHVIGSGDIIKDCEHEYVSGDDTVKMLGELVADHFCHHWKSEA